MSIEIIVQDDMDEKSPHKPAADCVEREHFPVSPDEIAAFFRSFDVDTCGYKFDREAASAR